jgi:two-component system, chemotaxis family, protein-glutamate methylesterase/glutaminase
MPHDDGPRRDLVVIGASAGGIDTLRRVVAGLPPDLAAAICVVVHIAPSAPSALAQILQRAGPLSCRQACDGDRLETGTILVAPPDHHLVIEDDHIRLTVGPRENGHRPAVDTLFRSAAAARNGRVIGVVLSGNRDDGTAGLATIKSRGGAAIVQDPDEALYSGMPSSAVANVTVDVIASSDQLADAISSMVNTIDPPPTDDPNPPGSSRPDENPAVTSCPDCGGVLTERSQAGVPQWRCEVGHREATESLADAQAASVEGALWIAIRTLEERGDLLERMASRSESHGQRRSARSFRRRAGAARDNADLVRDALGHAASGTLRSVSDDLDAEVSG